MIQNLVEISKLFIPLIALTAVYIAWQQLQANKTKVRLELYDKRFNIYNDVISVLDDILTTSDGVSEENFRRFFKAVNEAEFLLPDRAFKILIEVKQLIYNFKIKQKSYNKICSSDREDLVRKKEIFSDELVNLECELEKLSPKITEEFKRIMKFEKL